MISGKERKCLFWLFYDIVVFLIFLGNFVNFFIMFKSVISFDGNVCNEIIIVIWFLQVVCYVLNNIIGCRNWNLFFEKWDELLKSIGFRYIKILRKILIVMCILYCFWLVVFFGFMGIGIYFIISFGFLLFDDVVFIIVRIV